MARRRRRGEYGKGTVFRRGDRGTWSLAWRQKGERRYRHGFGTEAEARKQLAVVLGDIAAERYRQPKTKQTLSQAAAPWLERRKATHASAYDDAKRWQLHLGPALGRLLPGQVTPAMVKRLIQTLRGKGLSPATCKLCVALLSALFSDLIEEGHAPTNPCRGLARATRQLLRSKHDPKNTPYLHEMTDVVRVYQGLLAKSATVATAYAIGAVAGLRTSEIRGLEWRHVDFAAGTIHVQIQAGSGVGRNEPKTLKDGESRVVPVQPALAPILASWREATGGTGLVCPPLRRGSRRYLDDHTMGAYLRDVVADLGLAMSCSCCATAAAWYEYTRHTYACQWVINGGSIEDLSRTMGHSTLAITERHYVHLRSDYYRLSARNLLVADFGVSKRAKKVQLATAGTSQGGRKRLKLAR